MIKTGIDLVQISRVVEKIKNNSGFVDKILTEQEKEYCNSKIGTIDDDIKKYQSVAGIYAIKEAFFKAIGCGIKSLEYFKYIEVGHDKSGKPNILFNRDLTKILDNIKMEDVDISLSHDAGLAIAICVIKT